MPKPYSKLPHSPSGLVRTPTSDFTITSLEFLFFLYILLTNCLYLIL